MMKPEMILRSELLDILFEDRNKEYGAYMLRKEYHQRLLIALISIPVMIGLFLWMNYLNKAVHSNFMTSPERTDVILKQVEFEKKPLPKPLQTVKQKPVATIKNTPPVIVPNEVKADPPPPVADLLNDNRAISTTTQEGEAPVSVTSPPPAAPAGTGEATAATPVPEPEKVLPTAEVMPAYPGGVDALRRFLGRNLRMPENVIEPGQRIKVPVRFIVNKNGQLSDVEFLVQANEAFKQEILRVMNKMPRWEPGLQNGRNVAVYFSIPIIFEMGE
jgi:protein TonB